MPCGFEESSQRTQHPSDDGEGEQRWTETLEDGHTLCLHQGPETHRDPATRSRRTLPLHCCLMSVEVLGAHAPTKNSNRRATDVQVSAIQCPELGFKRSCRSCVSKSEWLGYVLSK